MPLLRPQHLASERTARTDDDKLNSKRTSLPIKTFLDRKKEEESVLDSYS